MVRGGGGGGGCRTLKQDGSYIKATVADLCLADRSFLDFFLCLMYFSCIFLSFP